MKSTKADDTEKTAEKNEPKTKGVQRKYQADRRQIHAIYLLANVQVVAWFVLSLIACILNYAIDLWMIAALVGAVPANLEPVSVIIPMSTNTVNILFLLQLRAANKRMDSIRDRLLGAR